MYGSRGSKVATATGTTSPQTFARQFAAADRARRSRERATRPKRIMLLVDRESNRAANLILCETEDDLRRVNAAMNEITPAAGRGARTSVEMYEVVVDEERGK